MVSSRRMARAFVYAVVTMLLTSFVLLYANRKRYIHLGEFVSQSLVPSYFQPGSGSYIVDIAIEECNVMMKRSASCGIPKPSVGLYGKVGINGGWVRVEKDLLLGKHWATKRYLSVKRISLEYYESHREMVILDVAIADPQKDCAIKGNNKCIPSSVLAEVNSRHVFNENESMSLQKLNKFEISKVIKGKSELVPAEITEGNRKDQEEIGEKIVDLSRKQQWNELGSEINEEPKDEVLAKASAKALDEEPTENWQSSEFPEITEDNPLSKRSIESSQHNIQSFMRIPSDQELSLYGWEKRSHHIWIKLGKASDNAVTGIDVLFGADAVEPRPDWCLVKTPLTQYGYPPSLEPRLSIRKGGKLDYKSTKFLPKIQFNSDGKFKVLQVADLHFSTGVGVCGHPVPQSTMKGCQADPRTIRFLDSVLHIEKPDFVVLTGDQIFGQTALDPETALFKVVHPFIKRKIPFAITMGNHEDESTLSREQVMNLVSSLPYSVSSKGPDSIAGFGNYLLTVQNSETKKIGARFYFLDSHGRSKQPRRHPGYDWFKQSQIDWLHMQATAASELAKGESPLTMAFFHIPLPEYRNLDQPKVGKHQEGITAPTHKTGMRKALGAAGVQVVSCGHDHANDFCLADTQGRNTESENSIWLCYGGSAGEGGYGGYIRRVRIFELDEGGMTIKTWKRAENDPAYKFDEQTVVENNKVVTSV